MTFWSKYSSNSGTLHFRICYFHGLSEKPGGGISVSGPECDVSDSIFAKYEANVGNNERNDNACLICARTANMSRCSVFLCQGKYGSFVYLSKRDCVDFPIHSTVDDCSMTAYSDFWFYLEPGTCTDNPTQFQCLWSRNWAFVPPWGRRVERRSRGILNGSEERHFVASASWSVPVVYDQALPDHRFERLTGRNHDRAACRREQLDGCALQLSRKAEQRPVILRLGGRCDFLCLPLSILARCSNLRGHCNTGWFRERELHHVLQELECLHHVPDLQFQDADTDADTDADIPIQSASPFSSSSPFVPSSLGIGSFGRSSP